MALLVHHRREAAPPRAFRADPARPLALLSKCPVHAQTPLRQLDSLARSLGIAVMAKDETQRMRLGSFKALGGAFAVAQMICNAAGVADPMEAPETAAAMTLVTASAGNHGLSVAAGAKIFGATAVIILPQSAPQPFADRIRATGARVMAGGSYDECVADAIRLTEERGWLHLADGSWPGYQEQPALVMEGYTVLAEECRASFAHAATWPTDVLLQAGVGGLAAAFAAHVREHWAVQPRIIVVEPDRAPCLQRSIEAGSLTPVDGPESNMARLDCKNASMIAFDSLNRDADVFLTISDIEAAKAVELAAQHGIGTTPSGAAGLAGLAALGLGARDRALIIITEGPELG